MYLRLAWGDMSQTIIPDSNSLVCVQACLQTVFTVTKVRIHTFLYRHLGSEIK